MSEKIIDTRISLLYNTYEAWTTADPILKRGEIAIVEIEAATSNVVNESAVPTILFKAGAISGDKKFSELEWASAKAADVHDWAKKSDTEFLAWAKTNIISLEVTGSGNAITGAAYDSATGKITLTKGETFATASELSAALETAAADAKSKADQALADAKGYTDEKVQQAVSGGTAGLASEDYVDGKVKAVQDQIDALDNTYATDAELKSTDDKVNTLIGNDEGKSVREIANAEIAAQLINDPNNSDSLNTLQEIADWIADHPGDAAAMNTAITALQNQLKDIGEGTGTVKKYVDDAIAALNVGQYALASELTDLAARVLALEGKVDVDKVSTAVAGAQEAAEGKAAELVGQLDESLAAIAKSGNINDLVQTDGDVLVLDCNAALFG